MIKSKNYKLSRRDLLRVSAATAAYYTARGLGLTALLTGITAPLSSCRRLENESIKTPIPGGIGTLIPSDEFVPSVTSRLETPTFVPTPTPKPEPTLFPESYPRDSSRFLPLIDTKSVGESTLTDSLRIQSFEMHQRLTRLGLDGRMNAIRDLFIQEEARRTQLSVGEVSNKLEWEYYLIEGKSWLVIPRDKRSGRYLIPVITNGSCEGVTGRKIDPSLATTLGKPGCEGDYFDLENLEHAGGLGETRQVVFRDSSGWFVFGEASIITKEGYAWYDMKKESSNGWTALTSFAPENVNFVSRVEVENEGTDEKEIIWTATNGVPGIEWQFDPEIQDWTLDVVKLLAKAGVEYPEATSSHFEADYGEFNFRIPKNISEQIGKPYIQVPQEVLEKMYLHSMGRYMLFDRRKDPERYSDFFNIAEAIRQDELSGGKRRWKDWPEFRIAAKKVLEEGPAPFEFKPMLSRETWGMKGEVINVMGLDFNFVTKDKYQTILSILESVSFPVFTSHHLMKNFGYDAERLLFVNGQTMTIFSYNRGWKDQLPILPYSNPYQYIGAPLEKLPVGMGADWYMNGLHTMYKDCLLMTQVNFFNVEDQTFFDPVNSNSWTENNYPRYYFEELMNSKFEPLFFSPLN